MFSSASLRSLWGYSIHAHPCPQWSQAWLIQFTMSPGRWIARNSINWVSHGAFRNLSSLQYLWVGWSASFASIAIEVSHSKSTFMHCHALSSGKTHFALKCNQPCLPDFSLCYGWTDTCQETKSQPCLQARSVDSETSCCCKFLVTEFCLRLTKEDKWSYCASCRDLSSNIIFTPSLGLLEGLSSLHSL